MFALLEGYDVQATRREAKMEKGIEAVVNAIKAWHVSLAEAMEVIKLDQKYRDQVIDELRKQVIDELRKQVIDELRKQGIAFNE